MLWTHFGWTQAMIPHWAFWLSKSTWIIRWASVWLTFHNLRTSNLHSQFLNGARRWQPGAGGVSGLLWVTLHCTSIYMTLIPLFSWESNRWSACRISYWWNGSSTLHDIIFVIRTQRFSFSRYTHRSRAPCRSNAGFCVEVVLPWAPFKKTWPGWARPAQCGNHNLHNRASYRWQECAPTNGTLHSLGGWLLKVH